MNTGESKAVFEWSGIGVHLRPCRLILPLQRQNSSPLPIHLFPLRFSRLCELPRLRLGSVIRNLYELLPATVMTLAHLKAKSRHIV